MSTTVGMRGAFDCAQCSAFDKVLRGWCPFVADPKDGQMEWVVDFLGDPSHDIIKACPKGIQLREPIATAEVERFHKIEALGGPLAWYPPPLSMLDSLTTDVYQLLAAIKSRYQAEVARTSAQLNRQPQTPPRAQRAS